MAPFCSICFVGNDIQTEYKVQSMSTGVCITCTFLDSSTTDYVAVVHQRISHLNSSGLMNIESSHKFTRSGDTAYGCIKRVNLQYYQVGVIGSIKLSTLTVLFDFDSVTNNYNNIGTRTTDSECKWCTKVGVFVAGIVFYSTVV